MDEPGMVSMFQALVDSGLQGFLGCSAVVYEEALVEFFANGRVRDGVVVSSVDGVIVEISEELFAETFELPVDGLGDLYEMPKDAIFDARSIVSLSGEPISLSGRKNQMKFEYRLLCDIVAKAISVKAGSFNAITVEKFSLMKAVVCRIRMNWAKFLFSILKKMVTQGSKQAKGFAIQISLLMANFPSLELGESSEFPASKVLTKKTVHRFVSINDREGAEEGTGAVKQRAVSKKRPAADVGAAVSKRKRTIKKKSISSISTVELVSVSEEAIPIQQVAEPSAVEEPRCPSADDVDLIIQQVLVETREVVAPADTSQPAVSEEKHWFDLPYEDLVAQWEAEHPVVTASDTDEYIATVDVAPADGDQQVQVSVAPISADDTLSADERMSLDDILLTIPVDIPLPSSCMEITKITMGKSIKIPGVSKWAWFLNRLPRIPAEDKGKDILVEKDPVKGNPAKEHYSLICADIELLASLREQVIDEVAKFFHSFSLKKLASINFEEMYRKEEQVLSSGETESPQEAIQRKFYILLKYRTVLLWKFLEAWRANFAPGQGSSAVDIQVIELLSDLYLYFLEELAKEARARCLTWRKPCCSKIFEGSPRGRGAVIARTNSNTRSSCWIRSMILVDGMWTVEPCADRWVKIPRKVISPEVPRQRQFDDTLPSMSVFFRLMRKRWADVCLEVVEFCAAKRLLPVDLSAALADFQAALSEQMFAFQSEISSRMHKIEQSVCDSLRDQADIFRNLSQGARQEVRTLDDVHTIRFNEFRKNVLTQNASIFQGLADVRQVVEAVNVKVDIMASRINVIQKDAEATKEALSHQLLEFQSQAQENHNVIHAQLSELVDYIHRGSADKKRKVAAEDFKSLRILKKKAVL
ncbi:gibberellin 2-beta-dioxygenase 1 [Dorcoceras hygrometricum]|uniref:Gibberellin 2-beta-dioxygenase 1 n=1 Tax=Dorcoceras hygrometricum TaxID=472368 RepID=A0A2Z7CWR0_9LAMI|nr:gibberellin 2-beta-dioxygenase 1 [Dorcoceras hygrometricum]